jgi:uncharacterized membrane protein (DUF4010 family)
MVDYIIASKLGLALLLGALIGLEREMAQSNHQVRRFAGIRTFMLMTLLGATAGFLGELVSVWFMFAIFILFALMIVAAYNVSTQITSDRGMTTEISAFLAFLIGLMCYYATPILPVILAIVITMILSLKKDLHLMIKKISQEELYAALKFGIISFVILPFLPNKGFGPLEVFNPYVIWLMVVFVSGISFLAYVMMRIFGSENGIFLTGILGGFASSTAVTISMSNQSKENPAHAKNFLLGIILACTVMFFRVLFLVFVINKSLALKVGIPLVLMGVTTLACGYILSRGKKSKDKVKSEVKLESPFSLMPAVKFGVFFAIILLVAKLGHQYLGDAGLYIASVVSGFADVDAITISISNLALSSIALKVGVIGILIAVSTNTIIKTIMAYMFADRSLARNLMISFGIALAVGIASVFLI